MFHFRFFDVIDVLMNFPFVIGKSSKNKLKWGENCKHSEQFNVVLIEASKIFKLLLFFSSSIYVFHYAVFVQTFFFPCCWPRKCDLNSWIWWNNMKWTLLNMRARILHTKVHIIFFVFFLSHFDFVSCYCDLKDACWLNHIICLRSYCLLVGVERVSWSIGRNLSRLCNKFCKMFNNTHF